MIGGPGWTVATWDEHTSTWYLPAGKQTHILEVDENMLVYSPPQQLEYEWPHHFPTDESHLLNWSLKNIGEILLSIHQQLVISNQRK